MPPWARRGGGRNPTALPAPPLLVPPLSTVPLRSGPVRICVVTRRGQRSVVAAAPFAAGDEILVVDGAFVDRPSRYTVQIGPNAHVEPPADADPAAPDGRGAWRWLNHSCAPNAVLYGRALVALRPIAAGADVTFDYEANEWEMAAPFRCECGAPACRGWIRGYRHLSPAQRAALASPVAEHIAALAALAGRVAR